MKHYYLFILSLLFSFNGVAQHFPGGVTGADVWYIVDHQAMGSNYFENYSESSIIRLSNCGNIDKALFNFNESIKSDKLCIKYTAPLESSTGRNMFFVGRAEDPNVPFAHISTDWSEELYNHNIPQPDWWARNTFGFGLLKGVIGPLNASYQSNNNANVNFYHWNNYRIHEKFKSYGEKGETDFFIGKEFQILGEEPQHFFYGNFPEFISFPYELTANERNRVESYLALKYGLTLNKRVPYRNSRNLVFWNEENNQLFQSRIFGIGRDDISNLNQLQSESAHQTDFLIASVEKWMPTNKEKQESTSIPNNHFLVFGDNGQGVHLGPDNKKKVRPLDRIWLSQNTGQYTRKFSMYFKLDLEGEMLEILNEDPSLKLWMLHDKYVTNQEESDFDNEYVEYYDPSDIVEVHYAIFANVHFDPDKSIYDQFTFGIGAEMIVQARFQKGDCRDKFRKTDIVITGGKPPYYIKITSTEGYNEEFNIENNLLTIDAYSTATYHVLVKDVNGLVAETEFFVTPTDIAVDLGSDLTLNAQQQTIILDAGQHVNDPTATYQWYFNGELIDGEYGPILTVNEPGEYMVIITSGDFSCQVSDSIIIKYEFSGTLETGDDCDDPTGFINLVLFGGISPIVTEVTGPSGPLTQVHNNLELQFSNLDFGEYFITSTDAVGNIFQGTIVVEDPLEGIELDILAQLAPGCDIGYYYLTPYPFVDCYPNFVTIDASLNVTNPNVSYEWFNQGISLGIYDPILEVEVDPNGTVTPYDFNEFTVRITNLENGCFITDGFATKRYWIPTSNLSGINETDENNQASKTTGTIKGEDSSLTTKVYPNPSDPNHTFYHEITASSIVDVKVQLFDILGSLLYETQMSGQATYTLPFTLNASGVYLIVTTSGQTIKTDKIIIK